LILGSAEVGASFGARAISHLEEISPTGIEAMGKCSNANPCVAVLLPTTAHVLKLKSPPARALIDGNVPVALGTDFNPNAYCVSMPLAMNLACCMFRMTMNEALVAATLNSAASINRSATHGSIEVGKRGDLVLLDAPAWEHLIYQMVSMF
jgi:imidazolonepropionase